MSSKKHNEHIPAQLLIVQLEPFASAFICFYQYRRVIPTVDYAGRLGRDLGFALSDFGMDE